jgi:hypothetical protein
MRVQAILLQRIRDLRVAVGGGAGLAAACASLCVQSIFFV